MPFVNPTLPNDGESADAGDVSVPLLALLAVFNGHIGADNLEPGTIPSGIGTGEVTQDKIADNAINTQKVADGSITPAKVAPIISATDASAIAGGAGTITPLVSTRMYAITALSVTGNIAPPSGTPVDGQGLVLRIRDNGAQRSINWNAIYRPIGLTLPSVTYNPGFYASMVYDLAATKWDVLSISRAG